jgi:hypothetical protein
VLDNFNNYNFCYEYLYYFFVAKYLAEHINDNKKVIDNIINNLHKDENAYIAIFVSHHSKNNYILDEIILNAYCLFDKYKPATLSKKELDFFDKQIDSIVSAVLPSTSTPEIERNKQLSAQNAVEENNSKINTQDEENDDLVIELRRSIKTVEVMGHVIKNRAGSLDKSKLELIFEEAMSVHLRILTSFFEDIKQENEQQEMVTFIKNRLEVMIENNSEERRKEGRKERTLTTKELEKMSKTIFWNLNFFFVYVLIEKIIHSIGSDKLSQIIEAVCDKKDTPASYLVKHGIFMWYNKNLQINNVAKRIDEDDFSSTANKIMKFMVVNHCSMHEVKSREKRRIVQKFDISSKKLLIHTSKQYE